ncbi:MAG TPA: hypothetical protein VN677_03205 [Gemmatimonadaceae bacterium]|jgi:hypothetical protein|nr:hypothetical protein [Gemmatimonadaceae bacterium]
MEIVARLIAAVTGSPVALPTELAQRFPDLQVVRLRRGGIPTRMGGWMLGQQRVAAITFWRTVFVAPDVPLTGELLLHELRHVHQFGATATFPVRYIWESLRHGYHRNRYETDAREYASERLRAAPIDLPRGDV